MAVAGHEVDLTHDPFADALQEDRHVLASQWCVGATLRLAREAGGESLDDVAAAIRIPANYLFAIEEENYYGLPGWAHAVGYVRSYALYLGLEPGPLVRRVRDQLALREHVFAQRAAVRSIRFTNLLSAGGTGLAIAAVAGGLWFFAPLDSVTALLASVPDRAVSFLDRPSRDGPATAVRVALKTDADDASATSNTAATAVPAALPAASFQRETPVIRTMVLTPRGAPAGTEEPPGVLVLKPLPRHSLDRGAAGRAGQVTLRARDTAWFRVVDGQNRVVFERQLARGDVQRLPEGRDLVIRTRNGQSIDYYVDGVYAGALGASETSSSPVSLANLAMRRAGG